MIQSNLTCTISIPWPQLVHNLHSRKACLVPWYLCFLKLQEHPIGLASLVALITSDSARSISDKILFIICLFSFNILSLGWTAIGVTKSKSAIRIVLAREIPVPGRFIVLMSNLHMCQVALVLWDTGRRIHQGSRIQQQSNTFWIHWKAGYVPNHVD